jgi:hypothetical protein
MKTYKKPVMSAEVVEDINEPVYMICSGSSHFDFPGDGWTHQFPEDGRWNFADQMNGLYKGPGIHRPLTTYAYVTFSQPVNVVQWSDSFTTYYDPSGSYTIVGERYWPNGLNHNEGIGLGALYVVPEDGNYTGGIEVVDVSMAFTFNPGGC